MSLAQFLGSLGGALAGQGPQPMQPTIGGFGGGTFGMDGRPVEPPRPSILMDPRQMADPMGQPMQPAQQPVQQPSTPGRRGVKHFLGILGDALLVGNGAAPMYMPRLERMEMGEKMAQFVGATNPALAEVFRSGNIDVNTMLAMTQPAKPRDPTALQQNIEYLRSLSPGMTDQQLAEVAQYAIAAPRMYGSPEMGWSPDPNYPFARQQTPQAPQAPASQDDGPIAVNPQTGERVQLRGGKWVPMGGGASNGTGGFPPGR